jgi:S1-C subfamily serine protease
VNVVDVLLVLAGVSFALSGFRQGLIVGVSSFFGFLAGGVAGMLLVPSLLRGWDPGVPQVLVAVCVVVALATLGQVLLGYVAARIRGRLTWRPARLLDSTAGGLVSLAAVLVVAWFVAAALRQAPLPTLSREIAGSRVLAAVDDAMPDQAGGLFRSFRRVLGDSGFPQVFGGLSPERIAPVDPPDPGVAGRPGIRAAAASVVRVDGDARECGRTVEGSGFVYAPRRVLTNAHVVAGVDEPEVRVGGRGPALSARVVLYDFRRDLAVLAVPDLDAPALDFDGGARRGDQAVVAGFPRGGPYQLDPARIRERISARGPDIYNSRSVTREVFSLYTRIQPGNSGGPLLSPGGDVYGVIFAKSLDDPDTGYALSPAEVVPVARAGRGAEREVDTGDCAA